MTEYVTEHATHNIVIEPNASFSIPFGPPTPGPFMLTISAEEISEDIPDPDLGPLDDGRVVLDLGTGRLSGGLSDQVIFAASTTDHTLVGTPAGRKTAAALSGGTGAVGERPAQLIPNRFFRVEVFDDDEKSRASGEGFLEFEVLEYQPVIRENRSIIDYISPPKWSIKIDNNSPSYAKIHVNFTFVGRRPIIEKEINLDFLNEKIDLVFNSSSQFHLSFLNQNGRTFLKLIAPKEWVEIYPALGNLELDLRERILNRQTTSFRIKARATTHDGSLAFRLSVDFPRNPASIDLLNLAEALTEHISIDIAEGITSLPGIDRPIIDVLDLGLDIFLVLRTRRRPSLTPQFFEIVARPRVRLSSGFAGTILGALLQAGLERELPDKAGDSFSEAARDLLGWLLGERDREVVSSKEELTLNYAGNAMTSAAIWPDLDIWRQPQGQLQSGNLTKIDHIVVLMMENRSFDHMLGFLSLPISGNDGRIGLGRTDVDGLNGHETNLMNSRGDRRRVFPLSTLRETVQLDDPRYETRGTRFPLDPDHSYYGTRAQRGDYDVKISRPSQFPVDTPDLRDLERLLVNDPLPLDFEQPSSQTFHVGQNEGFILNFTTRIGGKLTAHDEQVLSGEVMGYHPGGHVPVYQFLAQQFAICDKWFASHPGGTWPNRFVTLTGQLAPGPDGLPQIDNPDIATFDPLEVETIFDHLSSSGVDWRYYEHDFCMLRLFSRYTFDQNRILPMNDSERGFYAAARNGELPPVAFIDPNLTDVPPGNDDHPPADIQDGQALVKQIYEALSQGPNWEKTMLIIVYDEHGGFYDHVHPVSHPIDSDFAPLAMDPQTGKPIDFYGMRVPALVISPWVREGQVSKVQYDHTSILKTIIARFLSENPPNMGARVAHASDLGSILSRETPRSSIGSMPTMLLRPDRRYLASSRQILPDDDFRAFLSSFRERMYRM